MIMNFIRSQEIKVAKMLLLRQFEKANIPVPDAAEIERRAEFIVNEAHRTAKQTGMNVMGIVRDLVNDIRKKR